MPTKIGSWRRSVIPAPRAARNETTRTVTAAIGRSGASGHTKAMLSATSWGLAQNATAPGTIVFLTDGAIGNEQALFDTIAERLGDSRLFTVGIGSAPNALFMRKAARFGRGTFAYIGSTQEVQAQMTGLFRQLSAPVLTDVRVRWETVDGQAVYAQAPQRIPDLYAGEPLAVAVRAPAPLTRARIDGVLGSRPWTHTADLGGGATSDGVHVLWARRTIDDWLARLSLGDDIQAVRDAVLQLALEHHLVSRYTSLVAIDRTPSRPPEQGLQSAGVPTRLPAGWSATRISEGRQPSTADKDSRASWGRLFSSLR